jgi:hypothetical protein
LSEPPFAIIVVRGRVKGRLKGDRGKIERRLGKGWRERQREEWGKTEGRLKGGLREGSRFGRDSEKGFRKLFLSWVVGMLQWKLGNMFQETIVQSQANELSWSSFKPLKVLS